MTLNTPQRIKCYRFSTSIDVELFEVDGPRVTVFVQTGDGCCYARTNLAAVRGSLQEMSEPARALLGEFLDEIERQMKEWGCAETTDAVPAE